MSEEGLRARRVILFVASVLVLASIFVVLPFMDAFVLAIVTAYLLSILHTKLNKHIQNENLSTVIIISGLLSSITGLVYIFMSNIFEIIGEFNEFTTSLEENFRSLVEPLNLPPYVIGNLTDFINRSSDFATDFLLDLFAALPYYLIQISIFAITAVFLYKDRKKIYSRFDEMIVGVPDPEAHIAKSLVESIDLVFRGVFMTQLLVALILGGPTMFGFYFIGVLTGPIPLIPFWALLIALAAMIPVFAGFMVYTPLSIFYLSTGEPLKASLIFIYGVVVLQILPEVLFRPWVGSRKLEEHPLLIFIGFIAGPIVLGIKGIVIGPMVLILAKRFILNYGDLVDELD